MIVRQGVGQRILRIPGGFIRDVAPRGARDYEPNEITGLQLWLDFSDATTLYQDAGKTTLVSADNQGIGCAADKSGNGIDATQATADEEPLYKTGIQNSLSAGLWDGADDSLNCGDNEVHSNTTGLEIIIACNNSLDTNQAILINKYSTIAPGYRQYNCVVNPSATTMYWSVQELAGSADANTQIHFTQPNGWVIFDFSWTPGGNPIAYVNNVSQGSAASAVTDITDTTTPLLIGHYLDGGPFLGWRSYIGEVVIYNKALSVAERTGLYNHLKSKWGL